MKKNASILFLTLLIGNVLFAQEDTEPQMRQTAGGIFGGGGGVIPTWYFINVKNLNEQLTTMEFPGLPDNGMFMMGGHGYGYILIIPNLRIGGMGAAGSIETDISRHSRIPAFQVTKLSAGFGGVTLEYVIPFKRFHIAIGGMLGGGGYTLTLTQSEIRHVSWNDIGAEKPNYPLDKRYILTKDFFAYQPTLSLEYDINPFIVISATSGYFGSSGSKWKVNDSFDISDVPDFKFDNFFVRIGLTFGLFIGE